MAKILDTSTQEELTFPPSSSFSLTPSTQITVHQKPDFERPPTLLGAAEVDAYHACMQQLVKF